MRRVHEPFRKHRTNTNLLIIRRSRIVSRAAARGRPRESHDYGTEGSKMFWKDLQPKVGARTTRPDRIVADDNIVILLRADFPNYFVHADQALRRCVFRFPSSTAAEPITAFARPALEFQKRVRTYTSARRTAVDRCVPVAWSSIIVAN